MIEENNAKKEEKKLIRKIDSKYIKKLRVIRPIKESDK